MIEYCHDFEGSRDRLVMATSAGWVNFDEVAAERLAESAMLLACSPEHVERLRQETQVSAPSLA